jgi:tight adherence protein B
MTALVALCGAAIVAGLVLALLGWTGEGPRRAGRAPRRQADLPATQRRILFAALGVLAGAVITRWPVGALAGGLAGAALPSLLGAGRARKRAIARVEAVAVWTEMLRDMMTAASGLEEAIVASARTDVVPEPIRAEVSALAARLGARWSFRAALQAFGDDLADPSADKVIVALALAREQRVRNLSEMLSALARSTREHVAMRLRVETERAKTRASARFITVFSLAMVGLLLVFSRAYLEPFGSPLGQLVLLVVAGLFAGAYLWMHAMQRDRPPLRLRLSDTTTAPEPEVTG